MNEETNTPEPLAAILAEMREYDNTPPPKRAWLDLADRIEAAAEREYAEAKDYFAKLHDGPSMICTAKNCAVRNVGISLAAAPRKFDEAAFDAAVSEPNGWSDVADPVAEIRKMRGDEQPGNTAAMREALEAARREARDCYDGGEYLGEGADPGFLRILAIIDAALAAPARNVDRFATEDEAREAYWAYREPLEFNDKPFVAITEWLFAPAEGGDHD